MLFANSDLSGISILEKAEYRGIAASQKAFGTLHR
jgi:hypothetical protein